MSYSRDFFGTDYTIPARRENGWGAWVSNFLIAIAERLTGTPQAVTADLSTVVVNLALGHNITLDLQVTTEVTLSNQVDGDRYVFFVVQAGGRALTWADTIKWRGGTAPTITGGAGAIDIVTIFNHPTLGLIGDYGQDYS